MNNDYEIRGDVTAIFLRRKEGPPLEALIDTCDLEKMQQFPYSWTAKWEPKSHSFYVAGKGKRIKGSPRPYYLLHRFLLDAPKDMVVDHINHDTLDNTRENLRLITRGQNTQNLRIYKNNSSGVRGVYWCKRSNIWMARVISNQKYYHIGSFKRIEEAEKAVIEARKNLLPYSVEQTS